MMRRAAVSQLFLAGLVVAGLALYPATSHAFDCTLIDCAVSGDPESDVNPVFTNHQFVVTVTTNGSAVEGITVFFQVTSGPNVGTTGDGITGSDGKVTFSYTDTQGLSETDTIVICVDWDGEDTTSGGGTFETCVSDADGPTIVITKTWVENFVTGGGRIGPKGKPTYTFGGTFGANGDPAGADFIGNWQITKHSSSVPCHFNTFTNLVFSGNPTTSPPSNHNTADVDIAGTCNPGAVPVSGHLKVIDNAESGKGVDQISYTAVTGGGTLPSFALQFLTGGNIQVHQITAP